MEDIREYLEKAARDCGVEIGAAAAGQFQTYLELLTEWNEKINLTAITEPREVAVKHFLDSVLILKYREIPDGASLIDVGTGAGFPGLPLKIMRPGMCLTLLDGLNKRLVFLQDVLQKLGQEAELVHARAEEAGRQPQYRAAFDFAAARAVAPLNLLCEYCLPFLKIGGTFVAMKGPNIAEELDGAKDAIRLLGCELRGVEEFTLPGGDGRSLVLITRTKPLDTLYPRHGSKIAKKPL
jgi:16S rRNA (guanine(527)-N(7))-methyltransferase GidB